MLLEITILSIAIILFLIFYFSISSSLKDLFEELPATLSDKKMFSIIVALKNESINVKDLVTSLDNLDYPSSYYEVILVDDNSTDDTLEILKESICDKQNFKVLSAQDKVLSGKKGALDIGIKNAANPYIMITDADCTHKADWLYSFSAGFDEYDVLFGIAPLKEEEIFINNIACFENLRSSILTFALSNFGFSYSAAARSFGFTREAFDSVGGYSKTTDSPFGDDDLFLREAAKAGFRIGTITSKDAFVFSSAKSTFREYLLQKARHVSTSNHYSFHHKLFLGLWHLLNIFFLISPFFTGISPLFLLPFFVKMLADLNLVRKYQNFFGYNFSTAGILFFQVIYELLLVVHYPSSIFARKIKWK